MLFLFFISLNFVEKCQLISVRGSCLLVANVKYMASWAENKRL